VESDKPSTGLTRSASPLPPALRWAGPLFAVGFGVGALARRAFYGAGLLKRVRGPLPVLSIGNLTAGGTGKTPATAWLAQGLLARGLAKKPAILMRGYGAARPGELNDEARELARLVPEAALVVNPRRVAGCLEAQRQGCDVALLDDGFQHWNLARDFDLVLLDATDPFGGGHLLPWGRLREPLSALQRADALVLTRCDLAGGLEALTLRLAEMAPGKPVYRATHQPTQVRRLFEEAPPEPALALSGKRLAAACALGNPEAFFATLRKLGTTLTQTRAFPDHHRFTREELGELLEASTKSGAIALVVSEKDAVKLEALGDPEQSAPVLALGIKFALQDREEELWTQIAAVLKKPRA